MVLEQGDDPDLTRAISNGLEQGRIKRADWGLVDTILRTVQENSVDLSTRCGLVYALSKAPNEFSKQIQAVLQKLTQSPEKSLRDEAIYSLNYRKKPVRPTEVWIIPGRANSTTRYLASHSTNQKIHWQADTRHLTLSMDGKPHLILKVKLDPEYATEFRFVRVTMGAVFWFLVQELGDDWYLGKCHVPAEMVEVLQQYEDDIRVEMPSIDENDLPDIDLPGIRQAIADAPEEIGKDAVAMLPEAIRKLL